MPTVRLEDGLEMYYEDHDFTDPWRTPETVVMHHGNSKSSLLWYPWVPLLAGNYRVVRMDARGFGRSTVPAPGYDWSLEGFALDLKRFLDALGLDRVHLIGETVGGTISLKFASLYPERLRSATICSSPYKFVGAQSYVENRDLVQREGVEPWVRKDAGRRLDPSQADPRARGVVYPGDVQDLSARGGGDPYLSVNTGPVGHPARYSGSHPDNGIRARPRGGPRPRRGYAPAHAQLPPCGAPGDLGLRPALGPREVRGCVAGVRGGVGLLNPRGSIC